MLKSPFDFGPVPLGQSTGPQGFNVANTGDIPLTVKVIGGVRAPFSVARWRYPQALAIGESFIVGVTFTPTEAGTFNDVLVVAFNELDATLEVPLCGEGVYLAQPERRPTGGRQNVLPWVLGGLVGAIYLYNKRRR
jgi:hypothetical protein